MTHFGGPFAELVRLQNELNQIFASLAEGHERSAGFLGQWDPAVDVIDSGTVVRVMLELPGVDAASLRVTLKGERLIVSGNKPPVTAPPGVNSFHLMERTFGPFAKTISIVQPVNPRKGLARYRAGVLEIELPKVDDLRGREISIPIEREP